ncbi:MAG TPA: hypothetical protein VMU42_00835 [Candidatus Sulfotelmatobacter sp.]|nr:hypothetical protein [Candidatus Sulfotelmatobacter sp.]
MKVARTLVNYVLLLWPVATAAATGTPALPLFPSEQQARQHCPADAVVWLNTQNGIYHFKGQRSYAHTRVGAFACKREADKAGDRPMRNGQ